MTSPPQPAIGPGRPPGAGSGSGAVALTSYVVQAAFGLLLAGLGPCLVLLSRDLSVRRESLAWVSAGFGVGLLLVGASGEHLLRVGAWRLLQLSAALQGLGGALLALAGAVTAAQAGALLLGLGGAATVLATPVLLAGAGGTARMSLAFGLNSLTGIAAPLVMSAVDAVTARGRAALLLAVPALLWAAVRPARLAPPPTPEAATLHRAAWAPGTRKKATFWWLALVASVSPEFAFVVWGAARLQDSGLGATAATAGAAAFPLGLALGRLVVVPRLLGGRFPLAHAGVALAALAALTCAAPLGPAAILVACLVAGLGLSPLYPLTVAQLVRIPGMDPGRGSAVAALGSGTAVLLAPLLLGLLARVVPLRFGFLAAVPVLLLVSVLHARGGRARGEP
ncbi:MAG TPA: hypothetical protein VEB43_06690 [Anaeromyxobacter sp.]|nr:hypothetical protein [Anaeromyxobacter sp.]